MKCFKKILLLFSAFCLTAGVCGCGTPAATLPETETALPEQGVRLEADAPVTAENDALTLTLEPDTCRIHITEKQTGRMWSSNPASDYADPYAAGVSKTNLFSQITVGYVAASGAMQHTNSYASSIRRGTYTIYAVTGGFRVDYTFNEGFTIPVSYTLNGGNLEAAILYSAITEIDQTKISTISLLPYFGTADADSNGYLFVPDGSGALIRFNNGKTDCAAYEKDIYGIDESLPNDYVTTRTEQIYLPVIGMKKGAGAFYATAAVGAADASVCADVSGQSDAFNKVYFKATYRAAEHLSVLNGSLGTAGLVLYSAQNPTDAAEFRVCYSFLQTYDPDYNEMARACRAQLTSSGELKQNTDQTALYVDFWGGVSKKRSFLGMQYTGVEALTTFRQATVILDEWKQAGCTDLVIGYRNFAKSAMKQTLQTDFTPASGTGGKSGWKEFSSYAAEQGFPVYAYADFYSFSSGGYGASKYFDITKGLDLGAAEVYSKGLNTNIPKTSDDPYYLLRPASYANAVKHLVNSARKNGVSNIYLGDISHSLAGDYAIDGVRRSGAVQLLTAALGDLGEYSLMLSAPNSYLWKYAEQITDLPAVSSGHRLFDEDIPFLQMCLKGSVPYAGYALNLSNTGDDLYLKHIAYAQNLHYGVIADDPSDLQNTELISLYGLSGAKASQAVARQEQFREIYALIAGAQIDGFYQDGDLLQTVYSNGYRVLVNLSETDLQVDGLLVPARGYAVQKDNSLVLSGREV